MGEKDIKITFFHPNMGKSDEDETILNFALALKEYEVDVDFVTMNRNKKQTFPEWKDNKTFEIKEIGNWMSCFSKPIRFVMGRRISPLLTYIRLFFVALLYIFFYKPRRNPTVIFMDKSSIIVPIFKLFRLKVIYYCHNPGLERHDENFIDKILVNIYNFVEEKTVIASDVVLTNSDYSKNIFNNKYQYPVNRICTVYPRLSRDFMDYCVPENKKPITSLIPGMGYQKGDFVYLCLAAFSPNNKLEVIFRMLKALKKKLNEDWRKIHVVMAGPADNSPESTVYYLRLQSIAKKTRLSETVHFARNPSELYRADLILASDCVMHIPGTDYFDKYILEGMYAAKPVISSNTGGSQELINYFVTGIKGEPEAEVFAGFMKDVMDKQFSIVLGRDAKRFVEVSFSNEAFYLKMMKIICTVLGHGSSISEGNRSEESSRAPSPQAGSSSQEQKTQSPLPAQISMLPN